MRVTEFENRQTNYSCRRMSEEEAIRLCLGESASHSQRRAKIIQWIIKIWIFVHRIWVAYVFVLDAFSSSTKCVRLKINAKNKIMIFFCVFCLTNGRENSVHLYFKKKLWFLCWSVFGPFWNGWYPNIVVVFLKIFAWIINKSKCAGNFYEVSFIFYINFKYFIYFIHIFVYPKMKSDQLERDPLWKFC